MNRAEIEARLRAPHPVEREFEMSGRGRGGAKVVARGAGLSFYLLPIAILVVAVGALLRLSSSPATGALPPDSDGPAGIPQATKPFYSVPPETPAPPITVAACQPGAVKATLVGWGGAGGTQYALIRIAAVAGACSLPATPGVSILSGASSLAAVPAAGASRVALSTVLEARVGISSLCPQTSGTGLTVRLDLSNGLTVTVPLPAGFPVQCQGPTNIFVDDLFAVPSPT